MMFNKSKYNICIGSDYVILYLLIKIDSAISNKSYTLLFESMPTEKF